MTETHAIDAAMIKSIIKQAVELTMLETSLEASPETTRKNAEKQKKMDIPAPLKWASAIIAALMTTGLGLLAFWMVSTLNNLQITVARIDERQQSQVNDTSGRFRTLEDRVRVLEEQQRRQGPVETH
jgi:hypothetical protein